MNKKAGMIVMMLLLGLVIGLLGQGAEGLPELRLQKIVLEPPSAVTHGEEVMIRAWVMNTGDRPADDFKVEFFYRLQREGESWKSFYTVYIHDLAPSRQAALEIKDYGGAVSQDIGQLVFLNTSSLELGTYEIRVVADSNNQIPETDELNNELQTTLTLIRSKLGLPDLQPVGLSFAQPIGEEDGPVTVNVEIRNTGDENSGPFRVAFLIGNQQFAEKYVVGLPSGASTSLTGALDPYTLDLGPGTYIISGVVDADNQLEEQDEANNTLTGSLTLQELELHPLSLGFDRSHVTLDGRVIVSSKITNTGKGVAKTVEVGFYVNNLQFALVDVGPIGFGQEVTALGELNPAKVGLRDAPQDYEIRVLVDPHDLLHESDEANNALIKSLTILEAESKLPELHPESLELNPPSPIELGKADVLTVCSVVKNTGKATAYGFGVQFSYRVKGSRRWKSIPCRDPVSCTELSLDSGAELKAEGNLPIVLLTPGIYEIRVAVDPLQGCDTTACSDIGKIEELDETNNELVTTFTLLSSRLPDLSPDPALGVEVAPSYMVKRGQTLRFLANIANLGDLAAGQFSVEFAYCRQPESIPPEATDQMCAETDFVTFARASLPELGIGRRGQAQAILETTSLRPGNYHIRVLIDPTGPGKPEGEVKEQNEMNNILDISILLQGADLTPINLQLEPASPVIQGEMTKVTATVQNTGVEPIGKFDVNFYWCRMVNEASCTREGEWASLGGVSFPGIAVNNPEPATRELDTSTLEPGTYLLRVIVDPDDRAEEQSEINNELTTLLVIQERLGPTLIGRADLVPTNLEIKPWPTLQLTALTSVTITNRGEESAGPFDVYFFYEYKLSPRLDPAPVLFATERVMGLEVGEKRSLQETLITIGLRSGDYLITVVVDPQAQVAELNELNNQIEEAMTIP